ncbi:MAG TPA: serine/threonine-protein kinase, partial [Euzebyales bacterium]|nr:serine/threonine-protein kinase [Euzebyales bacterium]
MLDTTRVTLAGHDVMDSNVRGGSKMRGLGSEFGGYQLEQVVLTDALSVTYRARLPRDQIAGRYKASPNLSRPVLLRISDPLNHTDADEHAAMLLHRARAAARVEHPGVIKPIDTGYTDGRVYIATRWTPGLTLEELIRREGRMEPDAACALLLQVADGLDTLHRAGVVHGAISARTIWIQDSPDGRSARITGFAFDTALYGHGAGGTGDGVLSDAFYVAPEQFRGAAASEAADQYALACTLYQCVGGRPPFSSATAAVRAGALEPTPPVFDFGVDDIPDVLVGAIAVGMADQPSERYGSCVELITAARGAGAMASTPPAPQATSTPPATTDEAEAQPAWRRLLRRPGRPGRDAAAEARPGGSWHAKA